MMPHRAILAALLFSCSFRLQAESRGLGTPESRGLDTQPETRDTHLQVRGTRFVSPEGVPFDWRGISAFRLVEFVAHGREKDADAYLAWASAKKLTVVRVLTMAGVLFKLSPSEGQKALPRLLERARRHGLYIEVVALADTATLPADPRAHVQAIGAICARYPNALVEIANEPVHPTQARAVHDPVFVKALAALIPSGVPVSLGSVENGDAFAGGSYVTWHAPRTGPRGWPAEIAQGAALVKKFGKPVVSDEPVGAADTMIRGRRDNDPARFRQSAEAARRAGIGATFHYEGGLQARLPDAVEMKCLDAWLAGLSSGR